MELTEDDIKAIGSHRYYKATGVKELRRSLWIIGAELAVVLALHYMVHEEFMSL